VCVYTHTHTHINTYTHTHIHTNHMLLGLRAAQRRRHEPVARSSEVRVTNAQHAGAIGRGPEVCECLSVCACVYVCVCVCTLDR
jgi:hypothetical protein